MVSGSCASTAGIDRRFSAHWAPPLQPVPKRTYRRQRRNGDEFLAKMIPTRCCRSTPMMPCFGAHCPQRFERTDRLARLFRNSFQSSTGLKVAFGDQFIRVYGNAAVNTGYYTFSYAKDGEVKTLPARYSFTFINNGKRWLIVDHHSSAMPAAPK